MDFLAREIASLRNSVGELATRDYVRSELRAELRTMLAELDAEDARPASRDSDHGPRSHSRDVDHR